MATASWWAITFIAIAALESLAWSEFHPKDIWDIDVEIVHPRDGSLLIHDQQGVWVNIQTLGTDLEVQGGFIRIFLDGEVDTYETQHLSGRAVIPTGNHSLRAELHTLGNISSSKTIFYQIHDVNYLSDVPLISGGATQCEYNVTIHTAACDGAGTDDRVSITLHGAIGRTHETLLSPAAPEASSAAEEDTAAAAGIAATGGAAAAAAAAAGRPEWFEEGGADSFLVTWPCASALGRPAALVVTHGPAADPWSGFFVDSVTVSPVKSTMPAGRAEETDAWAAADNSSGGGDGSGGGGGSGGWLFECGRWLDEELGTLGVCRPGPALHPERLRVLDLLDLDVPVAPLSFLTARVQHRYTEPHFHYDPAVRALPEGLNLDLHGRFQSHLYFSEEAEHVRARMRIRPVLRERAAAVVAHLRSRLGGGQPIKVVSLHVRRGDNVPSQRPDIYKDWREEAPDLYGPPGDSTAPHLTLSPEYIEEAADMFQSEGWCGPAGCVFLVFTDSAADVAWCREHLPKGLRTAYYSDYIPLLSTWDKGATVKGHGKRATALTDVVDLAGIAACDGHIVSPSSFSWWGAWLNDSADKMVVVPTPWFNPWHDMGRQSLQHTIHPPNWRTLALE